MLKPSTMKIKLIAAVLFPYTLWIICQIMPKSKEITRPKDIALNHMHNDELMKKNNDCLLDSIFLSTHK